MRTNIDLDPDLVAEAFELADVRSKKELVHLALREFVEHRRRRDLRDLRGAIGFAEGYDHKRARDDDAT